jgi:hypothetical protein
MISGFKWVFRGGSWSGVVGILPRDRGSVLGPGRFMHIFRMESPFFIIFACKKLDTRCNLFAWGRTPAVSYPPDTAGVLPPPLETRMDTSFPDCISRSRPPEGALVAPWAFLGRRMPCRPSAGYALPLRGTPTGARATASPLRGFGAPARHGGGRNPAPFRDAATFSVR